MVPNWVQKSLDSAMEKELKIYKEEWLGMPSELVEHPFLSLKNAGKWVNLQQYELFLCNSIGQSVSKPIRTSPRKSQLKPVIKIEPNAESSNAHRKRVWEVIVISDDSETKNIVQSNSKPKTCAAMQELKDPHEQPTKRHASKSKIVNIIDSLDNKTKLVPKSEFRSTGGAKTASDGFPKDRKGRYIVTRKAKVDAIEPLDGVPHRWPVPEVDTAYVLDFGDDTRVSGRNVAKKLKGLDAFLKAEDQDSWGRGTNGSTSHDVKLTLLDDLPARHSVHECNGARQCEMFDNRFLDGYEGIDGYDSNKMVEIFEAGQTRNRADGETVFGITDAYEPNSQ
ncbi:hypothetical protein L208DRAFT_1400467 [Tricholoma matsutake]|nr:hypothetical protein L208DRAFT_1400467 [Tricholoma matsutake 945]